MKTICVDDEPLAVEYTLRQCTRLPEIEEAKGFTDSLLALDYLRAHPVDLAILDINMPQIDGITLAARIKQISPQTAILFLTAYKEYAFDAYAVPRRSSSFLICFVPFPLRYMSKIILTVRACSSFTTKFLPTRSYPRTLPVPYRTPFSIDVFWPALTRIDVFLDSS